MNEIIKIILIVLGILFSFLGVSSAFTVNEDVTNLAKEEVKKIETVENGDSIDLKDSFDKINDIKNNGILYVLIMFSLSFACIIASLFISTDKL